MAKRSKTFRLSEQALNNLSKVVSLTGSTSTAAIEFAIAALVKMLEKEDGERKEEQTQPTQSRNREKRLGGKK